MASLKIEVDKLDIDKLAPVPDDLRKLRDVVTNDVVKKDVYDKLVAKVNSIDTRFILKAKYDADKTELEKKIPNASGLVKKTDYNIKITEIEGKIPHVNSLAAKAPLTTVENKIPDVSSVVKETDYNSKITEIENELNNHNHDNLVAKSNFDNTVSSLDSKIAVNKTKNESIGNEFKKLKTLNSTYFIGKSHFEEDGTQNYLVFQPMNSPIKLIANNNKLYISSWKSKGLSGETIKPPLTSDNSLTPLVDYVGDKIRLKFSGSCLKQPKLHYTHGTIVNIYIVYELGTSGSKDSDPTLKNCLVSYFD